MSVCLSVFACLSVCLSVCLSLCMSVFACLSVSSSVLFIDLSFYPGDLKRFCMYTEHFFAPHHAKELCQPIDVCATRNRLWRTLAFLPLLTSSLLAKIGIIYTQLLQEEKIFPMVPRSDRVIGRMEPQICTKMLKKLSEKLRAKFPATTPGCSMLKITRLDDAFSEVF